METFIVPGKFYGSNRPNVKLLKKEKELKESYFLKSFSPRFSDELLCRCWKVFRTQQSALDYSQALKGAHVFSFESNYFLENSGQRLFLVTSYEEFWHSYKQLKPEWRIHYEIIPENHTCHLYFDIEFQFSLNPHKCGRKMMERFIKLVCFCFNKFGFSCAEKDFLVLSSDSETKFSRHVIVHLPDNLVFKNNFEAGRFAKYICEIYESCSNVESEQEVGMQFENIKSPTPQWTELPTELFDGFLMVHTKSGTDEIFCDQGVYSKNRNFRLYLSSKRGKGNVFTLAPENCCMLSGDSSNETEEMLHKEMFLASLVCNVRNNANMLTFGAEGLMLASNDPRYPLNSPHNLKSPSITSRAVVTHGISLPHNSECPSDLDEFVISLIQIGGVEGKIYRKTIQEKSLVIYDIIKNRWCRNVKRFHKSNNVRIMVNLKERFWYQKCHDPDCKSINYKSPDYKISKNVSISDQFLFNNSTSTDKTIDGINEMHEFLSDSEWISILDEPFEPDITDPSSKLRGVDSHSEDLMNEEIIEDIMTCEMTAFS